MKQHYDILGLAEGASQEDIQSAYERLSKQFNPDENENQEFFVEEYNKVQEAYKALNQSSILKNSESSSKTTRPSRPKASSSQPSGQFTVTISKEKIEELKNRKLDTQQTQDSVPDGLKILSVLSMIGSGLISIIFVVSMGYLINFFSATIGVVLLIFIVPFALKFIGALRMYKAKKNGFNIYMIPSISINILFFLSLFSETQTHSITNILIIIVMIIFSFIFYSYKKYLK